MDRCFFVTVKHTSTTQTQPYFTNCSLVLRDTRIYRYSALQALCCHYEKGLTMLCTYTPKILVKKFNISVDYFQCEKFVVIFFYCHTKIQTCISKKIERKKILHHECFQERGIGEYRKKNWQKPKYCDENR